LHEPGGRIEHGEDDAEKGVEHIPGTPDTVKDSLLRGCWWHLSGAAIHTGAFAEIGPFSSNMPQLGDWEWMLRCLSQGYGIAYLPHTLMYYRRHQDTVSAQSFREDIDIRERMKLYSMYMYYLSLNDWLTLHGRSAYWVSRRLTGSVLRGRWGEAGNRFRLLLTILQHSTTRFFQESNRATGPTASQ